MALEPPNLDDRRFQDIVDEMKRMIPRFTPEWTNHNVADPGVALIELFAWMAEMVLYRVNQVPDRLYTEFLNLVGIEPFAPSVARADITFWLSAPAAQEIVIPAGTEVSTIAGAAEETVVFATQHTGIVRPPVLIAARTGQVDGTRTVDAWEDLTLPGAEVAAFTSTPSRAGDCLYLGSKTSLGGLGVELTVVAHAQGVGIDPNNPPLIWEVWNGSAWVPVQVVSDSTGGLNKDGTIVLTVPALHESLVLDGAAAYWLRVRLLPVATGDPTYQRSPRISELRLRAIAITLPAEHSQAVQGETVGRSTGVPGQSFAVTRAPVAPRTHTEQILVAEHEGEQAWHEVTDFSESGPQDKHVVWDSTTGEIRFGPLIRQADGTRTQFGAVPQDGAQIRVTGYRIAGGSAGNVGARTLVSLRSAVPFVASVTNLEPAIGGVDGETPLEAKARGPLALRTAGRAVTVRDYEQIAIKSSPQVARARCLPITETGHGNVVVLIVPKALGEPGAHQIDDFAIGKELWSVIAHDLDEARPAGVAVEVGTPYYHGVSVAALVRALPGRPAEVVRQRVSEAIAEFVHPLRGGTDGSGWAFGAGLTSVSLAQVIEAVDGVLAVDELQMFEYDLRTGQRVGLGRDSIPLPERALFLAADSRVVVA
ncbi:putative baseplate assembly protein [Rarobacter faecitabidus]|uniref:Putative phage baseplate assembly protein n=1 Tax=Rarobacter faecitabidus TaxID=13243 RepID=A0A542ZE99_RARFA|nr:putative baseplate assembly protein [Rarobacter faecitabidus]TQL58662.1 putative phage baseplate assembly protein [Rarobacter faecitabidus]